MKLVIGGYAQGKLDFVLSENRLGDYCIYDGKLLDTEYFDTESSHVELINEEQIQESVRNGKTVILNHFHKWMRANIKAGINAEQEILDFIEKVPDCIVISDEIGNGIVPLDSFEREYRERTGRILVKLAAKADEVVRVTCGIGQKIK